MLNIIAIMGRLVADPEMRQTNTGKTVVSFRIACGRGRKDANGQNQADFFDVTAWEKAGEFVGRHFQKGSLIVIDGRLQSRKYQDKNGNNRQAVEIVANNVHFAGRENNQGSPANAPTAHASPSRCGPVPDIAPGDDFAVIEDVGNLPF